jgi:hypothetical protein
MMESNLPTIIITQVDLLALYDAAFEREDWDRADEFAVLLLRQNDAEEARS